MPQAALRDGVLTQPQMYKLPYPATCPYVDKPLIMSNMYNDVLRLERSALTRSYVLQCHRHRKSYLVGGAKLNHATQSKVWKV